jgi:hypothetical protein
MADNFNLRTFLTENKLTKNAKLLKEARVEGFDENQKAFEVSFINKYGGGDFRILNAETPEQAEEVFTNIFVNNPDQVQSIRSIEPYQVPAPKPQAQSQPGLEGVNYGSIEIDGVDSDDYPDFVDAYVISAEFEDGTPLSEEELEQLTDELYQSGELADMAAQSLYEGNKKPMMKETKLTTKERRLVEMVQRALGISPPPPPDLNESRETVYEDDNVDYTMGRHDDPNQLPNPAPELNIPEGDEMADETVIPEYSSIDELMKSIEEGTNKVAEEHKMQEMKKIAEALRIKAKKMEESEHAAHISPKDLKQLATDAAKLEKAAEKLKATFDKKFNKKEKSASAPKAEKVEALQETTMKNFDLKKFLTENKLTTNSRMVSENEEQVDELFGLGAKIQVTDKADKNKLVKVGTGDLVVYNPEYDNSGYARDNEGVYIIEKVKGDGVILKKADRVYQTNQGASSRDISGAFVKPSSLAYYGKK